MKRYRSSSSASEQVIELRFSASGWLRGGWLALQLPVITLVWYLPGTIARTLGVALLLGSAFVVSRMPGIGWTSRVLISATRHADDTWTLVERGGRVVDAQLVEGRAAGTHAVFVTWVTQNQLRSAIVLQDMVDDLALRRLRALLLISRHT